MNIVGIDPSLTATGIAAADGTLHTVKSKPVGDDLGSRLWRLNVICAKIGALVQGADVAVIEGPAFSRANAGTHVGAGLWWRIVGGLHARGVRVVELGPSQLKKFATGRGNADKAAMRVALLKRAGLDVADDNQADAWWLRQAGLHHHGLSDVPLPQVQLDVLKGVRW